MQKWVQGGSEVDLRMRRSRGRTEEGAALPPKTAAKDEVTEHDTCWGKLRDDEASKKQRKEADEKRVLGLRQSWREDPKISHEEIQPIYWGKQTFKRYFLMPAEILAIEVSVFLRLLAAMLLRDGRMIDDVVGPPEEQKHGWYRLEWVSFDEKDWVAREFNRRGGV